MGVAEVRRLKVLEEANGKLKQLVADLSLDKQMLQDVLRKKALEPAQLRDHAQYLQVVYEASERRACKVLTFRRSAYRYEDVAAEQAALQMRTRDLAAARVSYGYRRIHVLLKREGWQVNHKRVYRLYCLEGLHMRPNRPRRHASSQRSEIRPLASKPDERWAMDFMSEDIFDGRLIRILRMVDHFTRGSLAIEVDSSLGGQRVADVLARLSLERGKLQTIPMDNGPEFPSKQLDQLAYLTSVELDFSRPGKPTDNAMIEAFNARLRAGYLNESWFLSLEDARKKIEGWRRHYNGE